MATPVHLAAPALVQAALVVPDLALVSRVVLVVLVAPDFPAAPVSREVRDPAPSPALALVPVDLADLVDPAAQALPRDAHPATSRPNRAAADFPSWRSIPDPLPDAGSGTSTFGRETVTNIGRI